MVSSSGLVLVALLSFLVSGALVPVLVRFAVGRNLMDVPNSRSSHEVPTPRLGGVAVISGTWLGFGVAYFAGIGAGSWPLLVAATLVGGVGLLDDFVDLHFGPKAAAQALAAAAVILTFPPPLLAEANAPLKIAVVVVGVFWFVALCNAFNFMDGIDGITGGFAVVSGLFLIFISGNPDAALAPLVGAVTGFLVWNISPASMFMGDAGSYFIGFLLAGAALYAPLPEFGWSPVVFLGCIIVFTPYLFDTAFTIARRLRSGVGKGVFSAHREHIYQRITPDGSMHRTTANLYSGLAVLSGFAGLLVASGGILTVFGLVGALICCGVLLALPRLMG